MPVIRTAGAARRSDAISPATLTLAQVITPAAPPWTARALCAQTDPDLFFSGSARQTAEAKAVCGRCPVREPCLARALETSEDFGVWGGLDSDERRTLLRRRTAAAPQRTGAA